MDAKALADRLLAGLATKTTIADQAKGVMQVAADLVREFSAAADLVAQANQTLPDPLTPRELEVLMLLAEGLTNPQIAERMFVTSGTVKRHASNLYSKLAVGNRVQAVAKAQEIGLIQTHPSISTIGT